MEWRIGGCYDCRRKGMVLGTEIERKFLVRGEDWRALGDGGTRMRQGYLAGTPSCTVRVRIAGDAAHLTIKGKMRGMTRDEYEYAIPVGDAEKILADFAQGQIIEKTRFRIEHAGHIWEVDEFGAPFSGLVMAEVELLSESDEVSLPSWVGREVTGNKRYYNASLARTGEMP